MFKTTPQNILRDVDIVFQVMAKASYRHQGLFPAVAERYNGQLLMDFPLPPIIPGQRNSDRSPRGCNLQHDMPLLGALDGLNQAFNRPHYSLQRERYLQTFATVCCPASPTGLLPWGEHSYWDLQLGKIGNSYLLQYAERPLDAGCETHHQLECLPAEDWRIIHEANPQVLPRFVDGLDWHWMNEERTLFNRHAPITQFIRGAQIKRNEMLTGKPAKEASGSDFPGAAGVFIHDYAMALALVENPRPQWKEALLRFSDSWWDRRLASGICAKSGSHSDTSWNGGDLSQTLTLIDSILPAAEQLREKEPVLSRTLWERAVAYMESILNFEQPLAEEGQLYISYNPDGSPFKKTLPWAGNRGNSATAKHAVKLLRNAVRVGDERGLDIIQKAAGIYLKSRIPRDLLLRAGDPGA